MLKQKVKKKFILCTKKMFMLKKLSSHFTDRLIWKKYYPRKKICKKALLNILIKFRLIYHDQV